jgi:hypothetical protein
MKMSALKILKTFNICFLLLSILSMCQGIGLYLKTFFDNSLSVFNVDFPPIRLGVFVMLIMVSLVLADNLTGNLQENNPERSFHRCPLWIKFLFRWTLIIGLIHCTAYLLLGVLSG